MKYETLLCEVKEQVARVTLNRPQVLHALNSSVFDELEAVFERHYRKEKGKGERGKGI